MVSISWRVMPVLTCRARGCPADEPPVRPLLTRNGGWHSIESMVDIMRRFCLILIAAVFLTGLMVSNCPAVEPADPGDTALSDYLHSRRLPLVEARIIANDRG